MRSSTRRRATLRRGFTLVELLVVVAMIGILAALAMVGYRKYMNSAGSAEAAAVMQGIRGSEEAYKAEMLVYLSCSTSLNDYYPSATLNSRKHAWINSTHPDYALWQRLNVSTQGEVKFGYAVVAGAGGAALPDVSGSFTNPPVWPVVNEPWYVIQAAGDRDEDGIQARFLTSSLHSEIYSENDSE